MPLTVKEGKKALGLVLLASIGCLIGYRIVQVPSREEVVLFLLAVSFLPVLKYYRVGVYCIFSIPVVIPLVRRLYYLAYARPETDLLILIPDVILSLTFMGYLFATHGEKETGPYVAKVKKVLILYLIFLVSRIFIFNSGKIAKSLLEFKFYGPAVLMFFVGTACAGRKHMLKWLGGMTVVFGGLTALYGVKQLHLGYNQAEEIWLSSITFHSIFIGGIARPFSTFSAPATFADYQQLAILACCGLMAASESRGAKYAGFGLIGLSVYAMLITSVRSSWIGAVAGFLAWFFILRKQGAKSRLIGIVSLLVIFVAGAFGNQFMEDLVGVRTQTRRSIAAKKLAEDGKMMDLMVRQRITAVTNPLKEQSMNSRMRLWGMVFQYSFDPIKGFFGRGLGQFSADSLYFTYLAEFGYPGLILMIYILVLFIKGGLRVFDQMTDPLYRAVVRAVLTMNFLFLIVNITGTHIHDFPGDLYFWFWNGVMLKLGHVEAVSRMHSAGHAGPPAPSVTPEESGSPHGAT